ncbi:basic membrane protein A [Seinonella peptonophila]|uniref:Basic membrane protein A n=1 Tax=Seinonella peptonophila TaxID=112248 RepID=A0A1M5A637_9BACL|nr:BMP family ABC transporter substrate-binding protein [Seinonella peptonophila]SHF25730.1 basic membrane protein A [Seinonella peptonophila]
MKKRSLWLSCIAILSLILVVTGCGGAATTKKSGETNVLYYVNGSLGDKGFVDSAQRGIEKARKELGIKTKTVEGGTNQADWASGLESLISGGKYDLVVVGTSQMVDSVKELSQRYPDVKFIFFDDVVKDSPNVYSMTYSQSDGSFLAGAFAGLVTTSKELKAANPDKVIGFIGGQDIPIINDFKYGYEQGAKYIDPQIQVVASYVGDFVNAPKAKDQALSQYNTQKVDISFNVAAGAGLGLLEASHDVGKYSIGVDSNQNALYPGSVLTSMMKNIDESIFRALSMYKEGKLKFGTHEVLGLKEKGVGLAKDKLYEEHVPKDIQDKMKEIEQKLVNGDIQVKSLLKNNK